MPNEEPPEAKLFAELRDTIGQWIPRKDIGAAQLALSEIARIHYEMMHRTVGDAKTVVRLRDELDALKQENEQLRAGVAPADDPVALFEQLEKSVARLTLNMKKSRAEEDGLFCGQCGASISDKATGIEALREDHDRYYAIIESLEAIEWPDGKQLSASSTVAAIRMMLRSPV